MFFSKSISSEEAIKSFDKFLNKLTVKDTSRDQILIYSDKLGLDYNFSKEANIYDRPFHISSVGKVFTAVLAGILSDRGVFSIFDTVKRYFNDSELDGLFVFNGEDNSYKVTIENLLSHTSGIADYFEGPVTSGQPFISTMLSKPNSHFTPESLVNFTRNNQQAVGTPGERFYYSNTGYVLLGQLIEKVTSKSLGQNLHDEIFIPLGMDDSYLLHYTKPKNEPGKTIEKVWFRNIEISKYQSLSYDWGSGGIVSTTGDLLKFQKALVNGSLLSSSSIRSMEMFEHKFRSALHYGLGFLEVHFDELFKTLKGYPKVKGYVGDFSTFMLYDTDNDVHFIMNFGSDKRMGKGFSALIEFEKIIKKINK